MPLEFTPETFKRIGLAKMGGDDLPAGKDVVYVYIHRQTGQLYLRRNNEEEMHQVRTAVDERVAVTVELR